MVTLSIAERNLERLERELARTCFALAELGCVETADDLWEDYHDYVVANLPTETLIYACEAYLASAKASLKREGG